MDDRLLDYYPFYLGEEYRFFVRSNHSRRIRARITSFWTKGEQIWDEDVNNSFSWWNWWMPMQCEFRRNLRPGRYAPWFVIFPKYVIDPQHMEVPPPISPGTENTVWQETPFIPLSFKPWSGSKCYVKADRMMVTFTGSAWKPMFRLPQYDKNFEMSVFAQKIKGNSVIVRHVVSQPFRLYAGNTDGRMRGWSYMLPPLVLRKNDGDIGFIWQSMYSSGVNCITTDFEEGDVLEVFCPSAPGLPLWVTFSIVGGFL